MIRVYLRAILILFIPFIVVPLLIHWQPYDERVPSAVLVPVNCRPPCFMGIRPGITTMDEAITQLKHNEWVSQVVVIPNELHPNQIGWFWDETAPDYLQWGQSHFDGQIIASTDRKVSWMSFDTSLTMGDIPPILGNSKEDGLTVNGLYLAPDPKMTVIVEFWFPSRHITISGLQTCPFYSDFWEVPAKIILTDYDMRTVERMMSIKRVPHSNLLPSLYSLSQLVCGF